MQSNNHFAKYKISKFLRSGDFSFAVVEWDTGSHDFILYFIIVYYDILATNFVQVKL
jgi:hypothetical protein